MMVECSMFVPETGENPNCGGVYLELSFVVLLFRVVPVTQSSTRTSSFKMIF